MEHSRGCPWGRCIHKGDDSTVCYGYDLTRDDDDKDDDDDAW